VQDSRWACFLMKPWTWASTGLAIICPGIPFSGMQWYV
jgi:hypothetical protein